MGYYYHGTGYNEDALDTMIQIIESGGIKSMNQRNTYYDTLYNGEDYISVSKWIYDDIEDESSYKDSSFYGWIFNMPCFIIDDSIEAIHAKKVEHGYNLDHNKERVSEFVDEWHVKDVIPLDKIVGIALPFGWIKNSLRVLKKVLVILKYAKENDWQVYDSNLDLVKNVQREELIYGIGRLSK